ncbi:hypothetical protein [uncultured Agrobacterium sp.]|uniref:hypothetical protein n=1 Tax=uncultured Agrobacterium sp. TaxID=157277 RepID=UPI0025D62FB0|nr:hypothetical protein [uncultured Agrobacterium sp.]
MNNLPAPTSNARHIIEITTGLTGAVLDAVAPGVGTALRGAVSFAIRKRMEQGEALLLAEIERSGLSALNEDQLDFYVPAYYRFLEQVRLGEYQHNLTVLAKLITGGVTEASSDADVGRVGRAAQKLHMLSRSELGALAHCLRIFDNPQSLSRDDQTYILTARDFLAFPAPDGTVFDKLEAHQMLHELSIRGLLTYSGAPAINGAPGYYRSKSLSEIGTALRETLDSEIA